MPDNAVLTVNSVAPIRICDNGGWTDTWFARHGRVFNIAVSPHAEVQMHVRPRGDSGSKRITIHAENYGERYTIDEPRGVYDKHPLLEAALDYMHIPQEVAIEVSIFSEAPVGCSTGTSAAVSVALIGALDCLTPGRMTPHEVAAAAHRIETELLGQQCGIQDQIASAHGGINFIEMDEYPHCQVTPLPIPEQIRWELEGRLALVYAGHSHSSSDVHRKVIAELQGEGPEAPRLVELRHAAGLARDTLLMGDFRAFGAALTRNTLAQENLHPDLLGPHHHSIIDIAKAHQAAGWKVNGAGGEGGSVTILAGPDRSAQRAMLREIEQSNARYRHIPVRLAESGLRRW